MKIPSLENFLEVSAEKHPTKFHISVDYINPETFVDFGHEPKGLN